MTTKIIMKDGVPTVAPNDVEEMKEAILVDVRMADEYIGELGHVFGARLLTLGPELDRFLAATDKQTPIVFICRSGVRSSKATTQAMGLGFKNVYNMEGGMLAWNKLSLPITRQLE